MKWLNCNFGGFCGWCFRLQLHHSTPKTPWPRRPPSLQSEVTSAFSRSLVFPPTPPLFFFFLSFLLLSVCVCVCVCVCLSVSHKTTIQRRFSWVNVAAFYNLIFHASRNIPSPRPLPRLTIVSSSPWQFSRIQVSAGSFIPPFPAIHRILMDTLPAPLGVGEGDRPRHLLIGWHTIPSFNASKARRGIWR